MSILNVFLNHKGRKTNTETLCDLILFDLNESNQIFMDLNQ